MLQLPQNGLVVTADGHRAILLRNHGAQGALELRLERRLEPQNLLDDGPAGSRPEEQTPRQTDEATFAKQLAHELFMMKERGSFEKMVLIADPQTLGQLRKLLHKTVEECIISSLAKDLTNHSIEDIAAALRRE